MKTYLSIDLDYWYKPNMPIISFLQSIFDNIKQIVIGVSHEEIIQYINQDQYDQIINIDYHSDLTDCMDTIVDGKSSDPEIEFEEGTWANFYKYKNNSKFTWIYPLLRCFRGGFNSKGEGRCDAQKNPFNKNCMTVCGWKKTEAIYKSLPTISKIKQIDRAGIFISPTWSVIENIKKVQSFLEKRNIELNKEVIELFDSLENI